MALIQLNQIQKHFQMGDETIKAIDNLSLAIDDGELTSIVGTSGSGKSTLMNIIGLLDLPSSGEYLLDSQSTVKMSDRDLSHYRNQKIGFVFQSFHLLPRASALKNVMLPMQYATSYDLNLTDQNIEEKALEALDRVGLKSRMHHKPNELSGGQRQRVAIARALVNNPKLILADEPTGALDTKTGHEILQLFKDLNQSGVTVIIVTHDMNVANTCSRVVRMSDGKIIEERRHH